MLDTRALLEALLDGADDTVLRECLDEIVRIRAVQQMSSSEALGFVFRLKALIRDALGSAEADPEVRSALRALEGAKQRGVAAETLAKARKMIAAGQKFTEIVRIGNGVHNKKYAITILDEAFVNFEDTIDLLKGAG